MVTAPLWELPVSVRRESPTVLSDGQLCRPCQLRGSHGDWARPPMGQPHSTRSLSGPASLTLTGSQALPSPCTWLSRSCPASWDSPVTRALKGMLGNMTKSDGVEGSHSS